MDDLWSRVATKNFAFRPRNQRFDWKLLHGIDIDEVVRQTACMQREHHVRDYNISMLMSRSASMTWERWRMSSTPFSVGPLMQRRSCPHTTTASCSS